MQVVLSEFSMRLFCFLQAKTVCRYGCMYLSSVVVYEYVQATKQHVILIIFKLGGGAHEFSKYFPFSYEERSVPLVRWGGGGDCAKTSNDITVIAIEDAWLVGSNNFMVCSLMC